MKDDRFRASLLEIPIDRREHPELYLCEWYNVNLYWGLLRDVVAQTRRNRPFLFENFEWLAAGAHRWRSQHPHGDYPADQRRMIEEPVS
jgi:hypothetical protein